MKHWSRLCICSSIDVDVIVPHVRLRDIIQQLTMSLARPQAVSAKLSR
jgi:hypothetical protein